MSIKNGFGNKTEVVISNVLIKDGSNRNVIIQVPAKNDKRIFSLDCGYSLSSLGAATSLVQGRIIVVGTRFQGISEYIDPAGNSLPDSISNSTVYYDMPVSNIGADKSISNHFDFSNGIYIPEGVDLSVILTFCITNNLANPASDAVNAYLNVHGYIGGSDKIFKNIR